MKTQAVTSTKELADALDAATTSQHPLTSTAGKAVSVLTKNVTD
jgi:hypothetical protein